MAWCKDDTLFFKIVAGFSIGFVLSLEAAASESSSVLYSLRDLSAVRFLLER